MLLPSQPGRIEQALVIAFLFFAATEPFRFIGFLTGQPIDDAVDTSLKQIIWAGFFALAAVPVALHLPRALWLWGKNPPLALLVLLAVLSLSWSVAPVASLPLVISVLGTALVASYLALRFSPLEFTRLAAYALGLAALASLLAVLLLPDYAIMTGPLHEGRWRGITGQKNVLARWMAVGVCLAVLAAAHGHGMGRRLLLAIAALCLFLLLMAQSATAVMLLVLVGCGALFCRIWLAHEAPGSRSYARLLLLVVSSLLVAALLAAGLEQMLALSGRDLSLTDRVPLWQGVLEAIAARPWLGYGYGAFWQDPQLMMSYLAAHLPWQAPHAHNGWLEVALGLGLIGGLLMLLSLLVTGWRVLVALRANAEPALILGVIVLLLTLGLNLSEVTLLRGANLLWVCYLYVALRVPFSLFMLRSRS